MLFKTTEVCDACGSPHVLFTITNKDGQTINACSGDCLDKLITFVEVDDDSLEND